MDTFYIRSMSRNRLYSKSQAFAWLSDQVREHGLTTVALSHGMHPVVLKHAMKTGEPTLKMWERLGVEVLFRVEKNQ